MSLGVGPLPDRFFASLMMTICRLLFSKIILCSGSSLKFAVFSGLSKNLLNNQLNRPLFKVS
jgi:hypothetical protein